jgi:hypothetical protein
MGLLQPLPVPTGRWERIGIDFVVGLPTVKGGENTVCTIVDHATRRAHFIPMKEQTSAEDFAAIFMKNYFVLHGMPSHIVSDRDPRFLSDFWKAFVRKCGTGLKPSTPFHPQTDGATEKVNGILGNYLKAFATTYEDWTSLLPLAEFAYNSFKQKSTQYSPFFADLGYSPRAPMDSMVTALQKGSARHLSGEQFADRMKAILNTSRLRLQIAQDSQAKWANEKRREVRVAVGNKVWLSTEHLPLSYANVCQQGSTKLRHRWSGPWVVVRMVGANAVELDIPRSMGIEAVQNVSTLKEYYDSEDLDGRIQAPPPPLRQVKGSSEAVMEVERIVDHAESGTNRSKRQYRVRFLGLTENEDEWMHLRQLVHAKELVELYHSEQGLPPPGWPPSGTVKQLQPVERPTPPVRRSGRLTRPTDKVRLQLEKGD